MLIFSTWLLLPLWLFLLLHSISSNKCTVIILLEFTYLVIHSKIYWVLSCATYYARCWEKMGQPNSDDSCPIGTYILKRVIDICKRYTSQQISTNCVKHYKGEELYKVVWESILEALIFIWILGDITTNSISSGFYVYLFISLICQQKYKLGWWRFLVHHIYIST